MDDRLYRSRRDRVFAGVAGGLAERFGADVSVIRVGWVVLAFLSGGLLALAYVLMAVIVPEAPRAAGAGQPAGEAGTSPGEALWSPDAPGADGPAGEGPRGDAERPRESRTSIVLGLGLILIGVWFLVDRYINIRIDWDFVWPVVVIALGAVLVVGAMRRGSRTD